MLTVIILCFWYMLSFLCLFCPGKNLDPRGGCCAVIQGGDAGEGPIPRRLLPLVRLQPPPALGQTLPVSPCPSLGFWAPLTTPLLWHRHLWCVLAPHYPQKSVVGIFEHQMFVSRSMGFAFFYCRSKKFGLCLVWFQNAEWSVKREGKDTGHLFLKWAQFQCQTWVF